VGSGNRWRRGRRPNSSKWITSPATPLSNSARWNACAAKIERVFVPVPASIQIARMDRTPRRTWAPSAPDPSQRPTLPDIGRSAPVCGSNGSSTVPSGLAENAAETPSAISTSASSLAVNAHPLPELGPTSAECRQSWAAQATHDLDETRDVAVLVEIVAGMSGQRAEQVRGAAFGVIIAPNPPLDFPMIARWAWSAHGPVVRVHPGNDLVAEYEW